MTFVGLKTLFAALLLAASVTALLSMLSFMGRTERRGSPGRLRAVHRLAGYAAGLLVLILAGRGAGMLAVMGDDVPLRVVLHIVLAAGVAVLLAFKILFARFYRQFLKYAPALGLTLFALTFVVTAISAGFVVVTRGTPAAPHREPMAAVPAEDGPSAAVGELLFEQHCASCHHADSDQVKLGPGLGGLWGRGALVSSGEPVTEESVRSQIVSPRGSMPSFASTLTNHDLADLLAHLRTL